eukprot:5970890-Alexandrium_andersonii.AAC.1
MSNRQRAEISSDDLRALLVPVASSRSFRAQQSVLHADLVKKNHHVLAVLHEGSSKLCFKRSM